MKFSKADFILMRWSILTACASMLLGGAILYGSSQYAGHAQQDQYDAQRLLHEAQSRLATVRQDLENMSAYSGEYAVMEEHKIIGDEQRLDWIEGLEKLRLKNLVADFHYNIAPQKNYTEIPPIDSGNFHVRYSEMKLHFDLLHEAQLLDFFDALRSQIKGRYQLEGCVLQRGAADESGSPRLSAECGGGWITLKNRNAPP
ncbi:MAG: hypothetical protein PHD65_01355 [Gallionella sp.]|nr:hypothetical protein [Gallionella sp.]